MSEGSKNNKESKGFDIPRVWDLCIKTPKKLFFDFQKKRILALSKETDKIEDLLKNTNDINNRKKKDESIKSYISRIIDDFLKYEEISEWDDDIKEILFIQINDILQTDPNNKEDKIYNSDIIVNYNEYFGIENTSEKNDRDSNINNNSDDYSSIDVINYSILNPLNQNENNSIGNVGINLNSIDEDAISKLSQSISNKSNHFISSEDEKRIVNDINISKENSNSEGEGQEEKTSKEKENSNNSKERNDSKTTNQTNNLKVQYKFIGRKRPNPNK